MNSYHMSYISEQADKIDNQIIRMSPLSEKLKKFTYMFCYDCGFGYRMEYNGCDTYTCSECYQYLNFDIENIEIYWDKLKKFILDHEEPKSLIRIFCNEIYKYDFEDDEEVNEIYCKLVNNNKLFDN